MKKSSPISLFSFQDIITCLTGIMIVVVLVILLQLVESTAAVVKRLEMQPEYQVLKAKVKALEAEKKKVANSVKSGEKEAAGYAKLSLPELEQQLREELNGRDALLRQLEMLRQNNQLQEERLQLAAQNFTRLQQQLKQLQQDKSGIAAVQKELQQQQKEQSLLKRKIADKRKSLRIQIRGASDLTPLLVECNGWGFRCKVHPDGAVNTFGTPGSGSASSQCGALKSWLQSQRGDTFVVLLFRPASLAFYNDIMAALEGRRVGKELIDGKEEIF